MGIFIFVCLFSCSSIYLIFQCNNNKKTLESLLDDNFNHVIKKMRTEKETSDVDIELIKAIYKARLKDESFNSGCDCLSELSALGWNEYEVNWPLLLLMTS